MFRLLTNENIIFMSKICEPIQFLLLGIAFRAIFVFCFCKCFKVNKHFENMGIKTFVTELFLKHLIENIFKMIGIKTRC